MTILFLVLVFIMGAVTGAMFCAAVMLAMAVQKTDAGVREQTELPR